MNDGSSSAAQVVPVGLYGRVSDVRQTSVPIQLERLDAWVEREPTWHTIFRLADDGVSASRFGKGKKRADWQLVMESINESKIRILLLWELSRATRDRLVYAVLFAACLDNDVKIGIGGKIYDLEDPDDAFDLDLKAILAVRESGVTSKRVTDIVRGLAAQGKPHGRIPYGYSRTYHPATRKAVSQEIDPVSSEIVQEIVRRVLAGEWLKGIANDLNARKVPTPWAYARMRVGAELPEKPYQWIERQIARIATDPTLAGYRTYNGELIKATWPAIVDEDDHKALLDKFADPTRTTNHGRYQTVHLLTNLAVCGKCGATMRRAKNRGRFDYNCSAFYHVSRNQAKTDELVTEVVLARLERPDALELLVVDDQAEKAALATLRTLEARMESFEAEAAAGKLSAARLGKMERLLAPQIADAKQKATPKSVPAEVLELARSGRVRERWEELSVPQRRRVIKCLMVVTILPVPRDLPKNTGPSGPMHNGKRRGKWYPEYVKIKWKYAAPDDPAPLDTPA